MSIKSDTLAQQRQTGGLVVAGCSALLTLASGIAWLTFGQGIIAAGLAVLLTVGLGILSRQTGESVVARMAQAVGLMAQVSLLVAICNGHLWQIDMHMTYFAALAVLAIFADWPVILVAAATVAVHHLTLSFLLPALVFNGGGGIGRVLVHAVILIAEAATLMWTALSSVRMLDSLEDARITSERASGAALAAEAEKREVYAQEERRTGERRQHEIAPGDRPVHTQLPVFARHRLRPRLSLMGYLSPMRAALLRARGLSSPQPPKAGVARSRL